MLRKKIYAWHRRLSMVVAIPVVLWAASGFMHPLMTTMRPKVATQFLPATAIDSAKIILSLQDVLHKNNLAQLHNFRLVHIDTNWFYQVQPTANEIPVYLSTRTGRRLNNGDALYAQYLAKQFLEGPAKPPAPTVLYAALGSPAAVTLAREIAVPAELVPVHDCCDAATRFIMSDEKGSKVTAVTLIRSFDEEYKFVNRLLPAYKVNFDRADGIRVYVETTSDRFAFAVDKKRALFDTLFSCFHTWSWMDALGNTKYIVMALLLTITFSTTIMGLYIFFITTTKKPNGNAVVAARRNHRWTSVLVSFFTLLFSFSGAFHSLEKLKGDDRHQFYSRQAISQQAADLDIKHLQQVVMQPITNISVVKMSYNLYWQVFTAGRTANGSAMPAARKDLMNDKHVAPSNAIYVHADDYTILQDGEKMYARYLANQFGHHQEDDVQATTAITKFEEEYGFVNKRLPVWKISYASNHDERYYVETSTGKLAVRVDDRDLYEGYSFALLHKHHFMDFAGKSARDFSTMFWALAQIAMVAVGLILWRKAIVHKKSKIHSND